MHLPIPDNLEHYDTLSYFLGEQLNCSALILLTVWHNMQKQMVRTVVAYMTQTYVNINKSQKPHYL